ncbi:extracellular solute-binding protein [Treponema sp. J25]|uniref:extracellular solute-binding protein n=1 Tax=Treponema sp. J25 TaxID=2094121 RepID=UPI001048CB75|nr:extracellular solute-binding protein [Treponema sp. J25]TCW61304.1 ABC transporter substrate-binding protein [Treponema sp. J25]
MVKKLLGTALTLLLVGAVVFAEGSQDKGAPKAGTKTVAGTGSTPGWKLNKDTPITFDWYINFSWFARQWGDSAVSKYITQKTGVNVRFIVPAGNEAEKMNSMIAGNTLPDLITIGWWEGQVPMMIDAGLVLPLDVLAQQYDPYFFKVANPQKLGWYRQPDGHVYGYPNASYTPQDYEKLKGKLTSNQTFLVRKDIYEAIGKPDMTTPEGFLNALRAAKAKFPTVGGQPLIPIGFQEFTDVGNASLEGYIQNFLAIPYEKDGKIYDRSTDPDYIRWLKMFRKANEEGLLVTDIFVDKRSQIEEKAAQGRYFALLYQNWDMQAAQMALYNRDPNMVYIAVDGPKNSRKDPHTLGGQGISGWTITLISKNCKDPARAIQFLTYLISEEGQFDTYFGIPDVTYTMKNGVPQLLPEIEKLDQTDKNAQETKYGVQYTYWMLMDNPWADQWGAKYSPALAQPQLWTRPYVRSFAAYDNLQLTPGSDEALIAEEIARRWGRDLPRLLRAKTDAEFDQIWNELQKFKQDKGIAKVQAVQTEKMKINKQKLGIK